MLVRKTIIIVELRLRIIDNNKKHISIFSYEYNQVTFYSNHLKYNVIIIGFEFRN